MLFDLGFYLISVRSYTLLCPEAKTTAEGFAVFSAIWTSTGFITAAHSTVAAEFSSRN